MAMGGGKAALALLVPSGSSKDDSGGGSDGKDEAADAPDADYDKILDSSAKDILDADNPKDLRSALYEFVAACIKKESDEGE